MINPITTFPSSLIFDFISRNLFLSPSDRAIPPRINTSTVLFASPISVSNLSHWFGIGEARKQAIFEIDLAIEKGSLTVLMGPSGSGKSTLLNLLGCLDRPTAGAYYLGDQNVAELNDDELSLVRASKIGFVFQS